MVSSKVEKTQTWTKMRCRHQCYKQIHQGRPRRPAGNAPNRQTVVRFRVSLFALKTPSRSVAARGAQRPHRKSTSEALGSSPRGLRDDPFESSKVHFFTLWPFGPKMGPSTKKVGTFRSCFGVCTRRRAKRGPGALPRGGQKWYFFGVGKVCV